MRRRLRFLRAGWAIRRSLRRIQKETTMQLRSIHPGDLVEVDRKGRRFVATVTDVGERELSIEPLDRHNTYRAATSRQIVTHWRKARGGHRAPAPCEAAPGQTSLTDYIDTRA